MFLFLSKKIKCSISTHSWCQEVGTRGHSVGAAIKLGSGDQQRRSLFIREWCGGREVGRSQRRFLLGKNKTFFQLHDRDSGVPGSADARLENQVPEVVSHPRRLLLQLHHHPLHRLDAVLLVQARDSENFGNNSIKFIF